MQNTARTDKGRRVSFVSIICQYGHVFALATSCYRDLLPMNKSGESGIKPHDAKKITGTGKRWGIVAVLYPLRS